MFTVDHSKGDTFEPIKPGEYEATVMHFEEKQQRQAISDLS